MSIGNNTKKEVIKMPLAQIFMWEGISKDAVEKIIVGVTDVFVGLGIPKQAVEVLVHEVPKAHWGIAGEPSTKARPEFHSP